MSQPRLLDLFCGAGGAAVGYSRAGFEVVGVDIKPQPHYPFEFIQADALTIPLDGFDVIHASPPCEERSMVRHLRPNYEWGTVNCLPDTRARFRGLTAPWVIENVPGAEGPWDILLCGTMFGLRIHRHRYFQCSVPLNLMSTDCDGSSVVKGHAFSYVWGKTHGTVRLWQRTEREWAAAAGIPWSSKEMVRKAIPPAYTEWIGRQLIAALELAA